MDASVVGRYAAAFDLTRCVLPIINNYVSSPYHLPTFTTTCLSALPQSMWSTLLEIDSLTQMIPKFFSTASNGGVTIVYCTNATALFSSPPVPQ